MLGYQILPNWVFKAAGSEERLLNGRVKTIWKGLDQVHASAETLRALRDGLEWPTYVQGHGLYHRLQRRRAPSRAIAPHTMILRHRCY